MKLYHGSSVIVEEPMILPIRQGRDFGQGFYVTEIQRQAERWAKRKAQVSHRQSSNPEFIEPIVSVFEFDAVAARRSLAWRNFQKPDGAWLDMVLKCRANRDFRHGYDIVSGKIADDNVGETVSFVQQGVMRREDALERLRFQKINSQMAFCTLRALAFLKFVGFYTPMEKEP